jgi:pyruvate kinase
MLAGMDIARINMSHGERAHHGEVIQRIRSVAADLHKPIAIMLDLSGPKIRTGKLRDNEVLLEEGAQLRITCEEIEGDATRFSANYPLLPREVKPGDRILISDGELELQVVDTTRDRRGRPSHAMEGRWVNTKAINLPGALISIPLDY